MRLHGTNTMRQSAAICGNKYFSIQDYKNVPLHFRRRSLRAQFEEEERRKAADPKTKIELETEMVMNTLLDIQTSGPGAGRRGSSAGRRRGSLLPEIDLSGAEEEVQQQLSRSRRGSRRVKKDKKDKNKDKIEKNEGSDEEQEKRRKKKKKKEKKKKSKKHHKESEDESSDSD